MGDFRRAARPLAAALAAALLAASCGTGVAPLAPEEVFLAGAQVDPSWMLRKALYEPDTLASLIDGEAATYLEHGFRRLARYRYFDPLAPGRFLEFRFFEQESPLLAYALYALERAPEARALDGLGGGGLLAGDRLVFWRGRYFVAVEWAGLPEPPLASCQNVAAALPGTTAPPAVLGLLPAAGRQPGSERYVPAGVLGYDFLFRGVEARYAGGERLGRLVVCQLDDARAAELAFAALQGEYQGRLLPAAQAWPGEDAGRCFGALDTYEYRAFAARSGRRLAIALGLEAPQARRLIAQALTLPEPPAEEGE